MGSINETNIGITFAKINVSRRKNLIALNNVIFVVTVYVCYTVIHQTAREILS